MMSGKDLRHRPITGRDLPSSPDARATWLVDALNAGSWCAFHGKSNGACGCDRRCRMLTNAKLLTLAIDEIENGTWNAAWCP